MTFYVSFSFLLLLQAFSTGLPPPSGDVGIRKTLLAENKWTVEATDGNVHIVAIVTSDRGMTKCELSEDQDAIKNLLSDKDLEWKSIGALGVQDMVETCYRFNTQGDVAGSKSKKSATDGTGEPFQPEETGQPSGAGLGVGLFPGTRWCGLGNDASSYDDLGKYNATDACCRDHDHCPYFIDHFDTKYNYKNPYPWTLSHCDCDTKLYQCLKQVNTTASNEVGKLFYGLLNVKCFTFEEGQYCAKHDWTELICEQKAYGEKAVTQVFPHKWSDPLIG